MFKFTVDFQEYDLLDLFFNSDHEICSSEPEMNFSQGSEGDIYLEIHDNVYDPDDPRYYRQFILVLRRWQSFATDTENWFFRFDEV